MNLPVIQQRRKPKREAGPGHGGYWGAMDCSTQKTAIFLSSPISCSQALPFSTPFLGLSASCSPDAHLMLLGASSCLTTFCASIFSSSCHSPPISSSRESPLIHSLPLAAIHGCSSRCLRTEQRTCLCPHTAEGGNPSPAVAPCCLPHLPWVQVLTSASLMPLLPPQ